MPDGRTETAVYLEDFDPIIYYCFFCARMALQEGQIVLEFDTFGVIQTTAFLLSRYIFVEIFLSILPNTPY